jgi:hypothetical protein
MAIKIGDYEVVIKKGEEELNQFPDDLPVYDFEGDTVSYKEAKEGYMRTSDYTKKTQKVAEVNKFLVEDLGFQDPTAGVATMKRVLETVHELGEKGIVDMTTGEITLPTEGKGSTGVVDGDSNDSFSLSVDQLPPEVKAMLKTTTDLQKDMGSLMSYISRREITERFPDMVEEEIDMVHKLAAMEPSKSPMQHAVALVEKKKEWGQKAIDGYVEEQNKPVDDGHVREGSGEPALEMFGENPVFSNMPEEHKGKNVKSPSEAADAYLQEVFKKL